MAVPGWQLVQALARGKWSTLYVARPAGSSADAPADYVVKVLREPMEAREQVVRQFRREAKVARHLSHPHLVSALSVRIGTPPYYIVMPRLEGTTLGRVMRGGRQLGPSAVCRIGRHLADALRTLHAAGWVHSDVKPDNIVLASNGHATLVDLGFVRPMPDTGQFSAERFGTLAGTPHYAAPEAFGTLPRYSAASDIYSLGVTLYEACTGQLPLAGESPEQLASNVLHELPPDARLHRPGLNPRIARLLSRTLSKSPDRRPTPDQLIEWFLSLEIDTFADR